MSFIPILQKPGVPGQVQPAGIFKGPLPTFYMNDYSVMGLRVSDCAATLKLLETHGYAVINRQGCRGVDIRTAAEIRTIFGLLAQNGLKGELSDIAGQIYQG